MSFEESVIFQPSRYPEGAWETTPDIEDVWFSSADGTRLHGWFAEAKDPRTVALFAHGNGGSIADRRGVLKLFRDRLGASVFLFDYRGYGRSEGSPSERGVLADARAACAGDGWRAGRGSARGRSCSRASRSAGAWRSTSPRRTGRGGSS